MGFDDADRAAARALAEVDASAGAQLRVLQALQALVDAAPEDGVARGVLVAFAEARRAAFVRFHERRIENVDGALDEAGLAAAWDEAIAFARGVGGDVDAMTQQKTAALSSSSTTTKKKQEAQEAPLPFFARFLEHQKR